MAGVRPSIRERTKPTERIRRLREDALRHPVTSSFEIALYGGESWMATGGELWWVVRRARRLAHILRNMQVVIGPDDLLVGRLAERVPTAEEEERLARAQEFMAAQPPAAGQSGHMAPDVPTLLAVGCRGLQARIAELAASLEPSSPEAAPKLAFYRAAHEALDGLCDFASRYAAKAEQMAGETDDPERRRELVRIAEVCRRVPAYPARTFHEALQALHFLLFVLNCVEGCYLSSPGSLDRYLWPYLEADLAEGRLSREEAQELLDAFFVTFNQYIGRGLAIGLLVGGRDAKGEDVTNDLTWMCLHACDHVRLPYPSLGLRVHRGTAPELLDYALELLSEGTSQPALFNDEVVTEGLLRAGLPSEDACDYMNSTCVEITPCGKSNVWVASPYFNLAQVVLDIISDIAIGKLIPPAEFEGLMREYEKRLADKIAAAVAEQNAMRFSCMAHRNFPLASCFVRDCLDRGLDMEWGGARYNWIECSFVGLASAADSLEAIRLFIYERGELGWGELQGMLRRNFDGDEVWRQRLLREPAKYGNNRDSVDALARRIVEAAVRECGRHRTVFGAGFHPGLFAWIMHSVLGEATGATPDGRRAGQPLSPGPDPSAGRAVRGPTATILSATSFDHRPLIGGVALNLKFSPKTLDTPEKRRKLASLVRVYFERGGFQAQINVVDAATLRDAQDHPERHEDLLVRVAGYSDYFVNLSRQMQEEVIARTEYEL